MVTKPTNLEEAFKKLKDDKANGKTKSLLSKHLTDEVFNELKDLKTKFGSTLLDVISSGVATPNSHFGVYAPDSEAYTVFDQLLRPMIAEYHGLSGDKLKQPASDFGDLSKLENMDPQGEFVMSGRIRVARTAEGFPLNPLMTLEHYQNLEKLLKEATTKFTGELAGTYHSLAEMSAEQKEKLINDHYLFKEGDEHLEAANALNFWPTGRGIFLNNDKTFLVWFCEEDHIRIISMQPGADIQAVARRLQKASAVFETLVKFARHPDYGFTTFCPTNLGTTMRASFHIKLPKLSKNMDKFNQIAAQHNLQIRGIHGEGSSSEGGVFDVSNKRRLGHSEAVVINDMYEGCKALIAAEKTL